MGGLDFLETKERFIPFRLRAILDRMLLDERLSDEDREGMRELFTMMQARFHFEFHEELEEIKAAYAPFDPDSDVSYEKELSEDEEAACRGRLFEGFRQLLIAGNYVELSREQLIECLQMQSLPGLNVEVRLDDFQEIFVFYRGVHLGETKHKLFGLPWPTWTREVVTFRRVAMIARTQDGRVILKLFKDVVLPNLKIVSPSIRIRMPIFAQAKVGTTILGGLFTPIFKLVMAAALSPVLFLVIFFGCIGAFIKGLSSFFSTRTKYMQTLSSNLYHQSLASNVSVLTRLVDAGEAEEVKEMLLAYYMLYVRRGEDLTEEQLDGAIEQWFRDEFDFDFDFEVDDALRKLREKDLLVERAVDGGDPIFKVYDIQSSLRRMDEMWDNIFTHANEPTIDEDRLADGDWPSQVEVASPSARIDAEHAEPPSPHADAATPPTESVDAGELRRDSDDAADGQLAP